MPRNLKEIGKLLRYVKHIPPKKIIAKLMYDRSIHRKVSRWNRGGDDFDENRVSFNYGAMQRFAEVYRVQGDRFPNAHEIKSGIFEAKGVRHDFGSVENIRWNDVFSDRPERKSWLHDLSFFSFAFPLVDTSPEEAIEILARLVKVLEDSHHIEASPGGKHLPYVWSPMATSARIMSISSALALAHSKYPNISKDDEATLLRHIHICSSLLEITAERYLGYNHQVFAETALFVSDIALGREFDEHLGQAIDVIGSHTLDDGLWVERSATYHIHMLLMAKAIAATGLGDFKTLSKIHSIVERMQNALGCLVHPDGEIAIFNDSAMQDSAPPASIGWSKSENFEKIRFLPQGGFARIEQAGTCVIMDAGPMGPDDVIGHGHGDFLSLEVSIKGHRFFVDPGVSSISGDEQRQWTRSSQSHNGPTFEGLEPAEFFGAFRVGRRGKAWFTKEPCITLDGTIEVSGAADGYRIDAGLVRRSLKVSENGALTVLDEWPNVAKFRARCMFRIPDTWLVSRRDEQCLAASRAEASVSFVVRRGAINSVGVSKWHPAGPLSSKACHLVELVPLNGVLEFELRT